MTVKPPQRSPHLRLKRSNHTSKASDHTTLISLPPPHSFDLSSSPPSPRHRARTPKPEPPPSAHAPASPAQPSPPTHLTQMPPPPPNLPSPAPERRLAVLLSHLRPCREAPRATTGLASAERHGTAASASAEAGLSASPCATAGSGEVQSSGGGYCVFCNIVAGAAPAFKLYEDDECLCILDAKPLTNGHSLIIPKSHYPSLQTTPPAVLAAICSKLPLLGTAIMKATQCDAFNVLINNGEKAGQVVFHTHVHIIPRSKDDNLWSSETYSRNPISHGQETKNLVSSIKEVLSSSPEDYRTVMSSTPKGF